MSNKFEVLEMNFNSLKKKNVWKVQYEDGVTEIIELPTFVVRCLVCGDWINQYKINACPLLLSKKECCNSCVEKCKKAKICLLK